MVLPGIKVHRHPICDWLESSCLKKQFPELSTTQLRYSAGNLEAEALPEVASFSIANMDDLSPLRIFPLNVEPGLVIGSVPLDFNEVIAADILWVDTIESSSHPALNIVPFLGGG